MRKTLKSALSMVLSAAMVLTAGGVGTLANDKAAKAADATYTATLGGQMDTSKATVEEWGASATASFKLGELTTLTYETGDLKGCWSGNYVGIDTDLTWAEGMTAKVYSIKYDGVESTADLSKIVVGTENESKTTLRITLVNQWGGIEGIFTEHPEFTKMEITFAVGDAQNPLPEAAGSEETKSYTATLGGQMDTSKATVEEWGASASTTFELDKEATLVYDTGDLKGCWSGNYVGIDTDLTWVEGMTAEVTSLKYDGVESTADLSKIVVGTENESKTTLRITLVNQWGGIEGIFSEHPEFTKMEITFKISSATVTPSEPSAPSTGDKPNFTMAVAANGTFFGWGAEITGDAPTVDVTDFGTYSLVVDAPNAFDDLNLAEGAIWITSEELTAMPTNFGIVAKTLKVNDTEYDWSKAILYDDNGSIRLSVSNSWAAQDENYTKANPFADDVIPVAAGDKLTFTFEVTADVATVEPTTEPTVAPTEEPAAPSGDGVWAQAGSHAYVGFQMAGTWDYRDDFAKDYQTIKAGGAEVDYTGANVKDVLMSADGEYTISISGVDLSGSDNFNMLYIATDIERAEYPDVQVTNATVKIDGSVVDGLENIALPYKASAGDKYYVFQIASIYSDWTLSADATKYYGESLLETTPTDSIEITFTISGLGNQVPNEPIGAEVGKKFTKGAFVYEVTKQAMTRTNGAVKVVGLSKAGKKAKSLTVANTVKKTGTYNVTAIDKNAFKGAAATAVTLGKKIKSIPASAFANCKKLTKLTLKAKLKSVSKNAFKGCKKTITVKGTAKKANIKTLKKSGYKSFK